MSSYTFTVDTTPMAHSVDSAKGHINGVNGAVVAMQTAVIATERQASQKICDNVDNGFFTLMKSQISQKAAAAYSEMQSKQMILVQLAKALDGVKRQMENDYNMITKRYTKLFGSLNRALETRIRELDRPAMKLADSKRNVVFDRLKDDSSALFSVSGEALPLAQTAISGKLKGKTREAMRTLFESIDDNLSYSVKVDSILQKNDSDFAGNSDTRFIPVIFSVTDSLLNRNDQIENVYTAKTEVWQNTTPIVSEVSKAQDSYKWGPSAAAEKAKVRKEFIVLCEKESKDERMSKEIIRMFEGSEWEECKNGLL